MLSGADLDFKNSEGNTALQIATLRGEEDICASITSLKKK